MNKHTRTDTERYFRCNTICWCLGECEYSSMHQVIVNIEVLFEITVDSQESQSRLPCCFCLFFQGVHCALCLITIISWSVLDTQMDPSFFGKQKVKSATKCYRLHMTFNRINSKWHALQLPKRYVQQDSRMVGNFYVTFYPNTLLLGILSPGEACIDQSWFLSMDPPCPGPGSASLSLGKGYLQGWGRWVCTE